ncbi:MAG: PQQ-dependent sugar dehydrogenase [Verrucomicrobiae bacterium]|nr:PQQ-dependent sugar dehydrogenase [Verrucomicrobiae bacterium]
MARVLRHCGVAIGVLVGWVQAGPVWSAGIASRQPESVLVGGLALGASAAAWEPLGLIEAIEATHRAGLRLLEVRMGGPLGREHPEGWLGPEMGEPQQAALRLKVATTGVRLVAARVRFSNNPGANARLFEWAEQLGIRVLVGEPTLDQLDHLERMVRRHNIGLALATVPVSGPGSRLGGTDPARLMSWLRGRDPRLGVVADVLELTRAGVDPHEALAVLRTRLLGVHVGDLSAISPQARAVGWGSGRLDWRRLLSQLDEQRFDGYVVISGPDGEAGYGDSLGEAVKAIRGEMEGMREANRLRRAAEQARPAAGLRYEVLVQGDIPEPVHVAVDPDGAVWFAGRRGQLWIWESSTGRHRLAGQFGVNATGQRGLYSFAFDGGFRTNGHLYVHRAPMIPVGHANRVSRFTAVRDGGEWRVPLASERVLIEMPSADHGQGQGGGLLWNGADGCLYVGVGDQQVPEWTERFYDDPSSPPQDLGSLWGKVLRLNVDGGVPGDNPFVGRAGARPEVYAYGFRNPFSLTLRRGRGEVLVGDVGYDRPRDREEVNLVKAGGNYGWPRCDGRGRDTLSGAGCPLPDAMGPWYSYARERGAGVVVGPYLEGEPGTGWPDELGRGLVYGDFARRVVRLARTGAEDGEVSGSVALVTGLAGGPTALAWDGEGGIYLVEYGGWLAGHPRDRLSRLVPVRSGADGGRP